MKQGYYKEHTKLKTSFIVYIGNDSRLLFYSKITNAWMNSKLISSALYISISEKYLKLHNIPEIHVDT